MPVARVKFRKLHAGQRHIYDRLGHRQAWRCGRRFGKTELLETTFGRRAISGRKIGWFVPDYKLMRPSFARMQRVLAPIVSHKSKTEAIIELATGGLVEFWTLDNEDAGRSRDYDDAVIDEAGLLKKGLRDIVERAIMPTLLDRRGTLTLAGTPKGIDPESYFYEVCTEPRHKWDAETNPNGFREFHAPTWRNPTLDPVGVANLQRDFPPLVFQQEYCADFVDWSGEAFFSKDSLLVDGAGVPFPTICDGVFAVVDSATKTGSGNDGTAVVYFAVSHHVGHKLVVLDWDVAQIEGALLETWLPVVFQNLEALAKQCRARSGSLGAWIEDKSSGMVLIQQCLRRGWPGRAIDSGLTAVGKDERAISVSGYVYRGDVKLSAQAHDKVTTYKGVTRNHFLSQMTGFRIGDKDAAKRADDLLDAGVYGIAISLGNAEGF